MLACWSGIRPYVDCNSFGPRSIEAGVRLYGAERIVCDTDGTEFGCDWTRKVLAEMQIGEEAREQILQRNAGRDARARRRDRALQKSRRLIPPAPGRSPSAQRRALGIRQAIVAVIVVGLIAGPRSPGRNDRPAGPDVLWRWPDGRVP